MQSKYRKLYLYASNTQTAHKKPNQQYEEYKLKKQKSIEQLKQLLDSKVTLPPVASLLAFQDNQRVQEKQYKPTENKSFKILKLRSKSNSLTHKQSFLPSARRVFQPDLPKSERKIKIVKPREERTEKDYEKYINQYMEKLQKLHVLEKYADQDYSKLVQDACKQIRKKINEDQLEIQQVQKSLQESRDFSMLGLKAGKKKKQKKPKQIKKKQKQDEQPSINSHFYISNTTDRLFLNRNQHKKSKSLAQNNLYKLNLQLVQKTNALKNKARKRSQKQFVRNLARHSFGDTLVPFSSKQ